MGAVAHAVTERGKAVWLPFRRQHAAGVIRAEVGEIHAQLVLIVDGQDAEEQCMPGAAQWVMTLAAHIARLQAHYGIARRLQRALNGVGGKARSEAAAITGHSLPPLRRL